jgi:hypothetical protein
MPRKIDMNKFATKKELEKHMKQVERMIKKSTKSVKTWDIKQDKKLIIKSKRN